MNLLLTDDDADDEKSNNPVDRILESSFSSPFIKSNDPDETYCSVLEEVKIVQQKPQFSSKKSHYSSDVRPAVLQLLENFLMMTCSQE